MYTVGSLFSGIGGIDLAFVAANFDIAFQVEIDDYCTKVLEKHHDRYWSNAKRFTDIRAVTGNELPEVTVLCGGFPCQDLSVAGKRAGIAEGTRSGLWSEFARLIGDLRPRVVLLENVPGILTLGGPTVIADLAKMGYVGHWGTLSAADAGAPHRRERWFCVAYAISDGNGIDGAGQALHHRKRNGSPHEQRRVIKQLGSVAHGQSMDNAKKSGLPNRQRPTKSTHYSQDRKGLGRHGLKRSGAGSTKPRLGRDAHGLSAGLGRHQWPARPGQPQFAYEPPRVVSGQPHRTQRLKALGNSVVPQCVYPIACAIREYLEAQDAAETEYVR